MSTIESQGDKNDASFMMTDAYSGAGAVVTETEEWRANLGKNLVVESKAVAGNFWAAQEEGRDSQGILEIQGHVFRVSEHTYHQST
jgi:hypothetical protein